MDRGLRTISARGGWRARLAAPPRRAPAAPGSRPPATAAPAASAATAIWSTGIGVNAAALGPLAQVIGNGALPPANLIPIYKAAGRQYHLPWQVLAAINGI